MTARGGRKTLAGLGVAVSDLESARHKRHEASAWNAVREASADAGDVVAVLVVAGAGEWLAVHAVAKCTCDGGVAGPSLKMAHVPGDRGTCQVIAARVRGQGRDVLALGAADGGWSAVCYGPSAFKKEARC